jgi:hypothetical protein
LRSDGDDQSHPEALPCAGTNLVDSFPFTLSLLVAALCHAAAMGNKNAPKREAKKPKKKKA